LAKAGDQDGFYRAKVATARFFMQRLLPQTSGLLQAIMAGGGSIMAFDEAAF
jgi:butyryl-CoA dehydrogenase